MTSGIVWLASYPKSGNTWFRAVYTSWRTGAPVDLNELSAAGVGSIASSRARIESVLGVPTSLLSPDEIDLLRPRVDDVIGFGGAGPRSHGDPEAGLDPDRVDRAAGQAAIHKIHDALFAGPAGELIVSVAATQGAVYMIRDPRDVALSYANHNRSDHAHAVAQLGSTRAVLAGGSERIGSQVRQRLGTWSDHVRSWVDDAPFPVHVVRYEDCIARPVSVFAEALRFAGHHADTDDVAAAVEHTRFERLRSQEIEGGFREKPPGVDAFFRRGQVGAWRDELDPDLAARVEADHGDVMRRFGYFETGADA